MTRLHPSRAPPPVQISPESARAAGLRLLARLELPDCECPPFLACPCGEACRPLPPGAHGPPSCPHCAGLCDCPPELYQPPCHHITAQDWEARGELAFGDWVELLYLLQPGLFTEPRPPDGPALALTREARVAVYARRHQQQCGLYHRADFWRGSAADDAIRAGILAERLDNGYLDPDQRLAVAGRVGPEEAECSLADELLDEMGEGQLDLFRRGRERWNARTAAPAAGRKAA